MEKLKTKSKTPTEKETRQKLLTAARGLGCEATLIKIFARYDDLIKGSKTIDETQALQRLGVEEVNALFNIYQNHNFYDAKRDTWMNLTVDGKPLGDDKK